MTSRTIAGQPYRDAPLRILLCHNRYRNATGEDIAFDLACGLLRGAGHEIVLHLRDNRDTAKLRLSEKLLFPARTIYSRATEREIVEVVRRERPNIAVVQNVFPLLSPSVYRGLRGAGIPVVQLVFNYRLLCANAQLFTKGSICERCVHGNFLHAVAHRCYRNSYTLSATYGAALQLHRWAGTWTRCIDRFVVPDQFLGDKLAEAGFDRSAMSVVPNPLDLQRYRQTKGGDYFVFIGRLVRQKGVMTLLHAALQCDVPVVVAGAGEHEQQVKEHESVRSGRVRFVGPAYGDDFNRLIEGSAAVVVPSEWYDNLPMIVCQAFASGKPVIASRINGIPEYVHHGFNGALFEPGNVAELALCMQRMWEDRAGCERLGHQARRYAEEHLSTSSWLHAMESVFREVRDSAVTGAGA